MELLLAVFPLEQALAWLVGALSLGTSEAGDKGGGMKVFCSVAAGLIFLWSPGLAGADEERALFNGKDLTGWQGMQGPSDNWGVKDGALTCTGGKGAQWLATKEEFADFDLSLEFKLPVNGNSGVFIRAPRQGTPYVDGMEIQLLDDYGEKWKNLKPDQFTGAIYAAVAPSRRVTKKANEWQTMRILCVGRSCSVWVNAQQIIKVNLDELAEKYGRKVPGLKRNSGLIGVQNHGDPVSFRKVIIKTLDRASAPVEKAAERGAYQK